MINSEQKVEECDATKDAQGTNAGNTIIKYFCKELSNKK